MAHSGRIAVCAVILAAGESSRFGEDNKLLSEVKGVPILERVVRAMVASKVDSVQVVTGWDHKKVASLVSEYDVKCIHNPGWNKGMGASLAVGAAAVDSGECSGIMVCLGDLPYLEPGTIDSVIDTFYESNGNRIVVPVFQGRRGHPVLFPISFLKELTRLSGDEGAREIIRKSFTDIDLVELGAVGILKDIDTQADL